jgi:hypothetical protein
MVIHGAVIQEKGVNFAVVVVQPQVLANRAGVQKTVDGLKPIFSGLPIVLMAQNENGKPVFCGRSDLVEFLAGLTVQQIPWQRYEVQAA